MIVNVLPAHVSLKRIDQFFHEPETRKYTLAESIPPGAPIIGFVNGSFTWSNERLAKSDPSIFRVKDLNLDFPLDVLSIVVGSGEWFLLCIVELKALSLTLVVIKSEVAKPPFSFPSWARRIVFEDIPSFHPRSLDPLPRIRPF